MCGRQERFGSLAELRGRYKLSLYLRAAFEVRAEARSELFAMQCHVPFQRRLRELGDRGRAVPGGNQPTCLGGDGEAERLRPLGEEGTGFPTADGEAAPRAALDRDRRARPSSGFRPRWNPGVSASATIKLTPRWRPFGSVLQAMITRSQLIPLLIIVLAPLIT
jgi:hypothetical protein